MSYKHKIIDCIDYIICNREKGVTIQDMIDDLNMSHQTARHYVRTLTENHYNFCVFKKELVKNTLIKKGGMGGNMKYLITCKLTGLK